MKVFVTGVSGYAGFYVALRLAATGHTVAGLVRNPEQRRLNILRMQEVHLICGDVCQPETYRTEVERSDVVVHAMLDKKRHIEADRAMFTALQQLPPKPQQRRFIYTTGCSIFGNVSDAVLDEHTEPNPDHPLSFRRGLEREALALTNVGTVVLRPGFMFGNDGFNSVSTDWFAMAKQGDPVFRADHNIGWSWIHIADLAEAYRLAVEADEGIVTGEIFHLADEHRPRSLDVMRACVDAAGYKGDIRFEAPKKGDNVSTWFNQNEFVSSRKARGRLGWSTRHDGILETVIPVYEAWKAAQTNAAQLER
jgi:nucleoside-diphosphate-sugar epimerase